MHTSPSFSTSFMAFLTTSNWRTAFAFLRKRQKEHENQILHFQRWGVCAARLFVLDCMLMTDQGGQETLAMHWARILTA
jgi:hypothetical protein